MCSVQRHSAQTTVKDDDNHYLSKIATQYLKWNYPTAIHVGKHIMNSSFASTDLRKMYVERERERGGMGEGWRGRERGDAGGG